MNETSPDPYSVGLVSHVADLILKGATKAQIRKHLAAKSGVTDEEADSAIEKAIASIMADYPGLGQYEAIAIAQRSVLLVESWRVNDYRTCLAILQDIAKLQGAYQRPTLPTGKQADAPQPTSKAMTIEEMKKRLRVYDDC